MSQRRATEVFNDWPRLLWTAWSLVVRVGAGLGLVFFGPIFGAISLAILLGDGRPVFSRQRRIGADGEPHVILRFRTMAKASNRHSRVGLFIRRYDLHLLPQLIKMASQGAPMPARYARIGTRSATQQPSRAARSLVSVGVWLLPPETRADYQEEFAAELAEVASNAVHRRRAQWGYALRTLVSAVPLRRVLTRASRQTAGW